MRSHLVTSLPVALSGVLLWFQAAASLQARETTILDIYGPGLAAAGPQGGDLPLARSQARAINATRTIFPFLQESLEFGNNGPVFPFDYEIKSHVPSDLEVQEDQLMIEDAFKMLNERRDDNVAASFNGDRPKTTIYSVAVAIPFPNRDFAPQSLAYSAGNQDEKAARSYNGKLRHRWVVMAGERFHANTGFLGCTTIPLGEDEFNVARGERDASIAERRVPYGPTRSIFAQLNAPGHSVDEAREHMSEAGFHMDSVDFNGGGDKARRRQFRLIRFTATAYADNAR